MDLYIQLLVLLGSVVFTASKKPSILLMVADDLGIGDIGCFGNKTLQTPHIDSIARDGILLSQHLTAASLCSPSRAALLTGRYPVRSGMNPPGVPRVGIYIASTYGLPTTEVTFGKLAKQAGYKTGYIGKWHQGWSEHTRDDFLHHPRSHGFDYFYGLPLTNLRDFGDDGESLIHVYSPTFTYRVITIALVIILSAYSLWRMNYIGTCSFFFTSLTVVLIFGAAYFIATNLKLLNSAIYRNFDLVEQPIDLETQMRKEVLEGQEFLKARRDDGQPFLLVMSWIHVHTYLTPAKRFAGKTRHGKYGDSVEEMDWAVGEMLGALQQMGLADDTLVYFTSDNGGHLEETDLKGVREGGSNGIYKGGKGHGAVDGGIRVPTVVKWPGQIPPGMKSDEPTSQMDILPTLAAMMGVPVPADRDIDGKDIMPLLTRRADVSPHDFLFHYCGDELHAVRYRPREGNTVWKLVLKEPNYFPGTQRCEFVCVCQDAIVLDPPHLYDMTSDPGETKPLPVTRHPEVYERMTSAAERHLKTVQYGTSQYSIAKLVWRPWLQMCCNNNYPTCECQDDKFKGTFLD